jgi:hypothetical protein
MLPRPSAFSGGLEPLCVGHTQQAARHGHPHLEKSGQLGENVRNDDEPLHVRPAYVGQPFDRLVSVCMRQRGVAPQQQVEQLAVLQPQ